MRTHTDEEKNAAVHAIWLAAHDLKAPVETYIELAAKLLRITEEELGGRLEDYYVATAAFTRRPPDWKPEDSLRQIIPVTVITD